MKLNICNFLNCPKKWGKNLFNFIVNLNVLICRVTSSVVCDSRIASCLTLFHVWALIFKFKKSHGCTHTQWRLVDAIARSPMFKNRDLHWKVKSFKSLWCMMHFVTVRPVSATQGMKLELGSSVTKIGQSVYEYWTVWKRGLKSSFFRVFWRDFCRETISGPRHGPAIHDWRPPEARNVRDRSRSEITRRAQTSRHQPNGPDKAAE